MAKRRYKPRKGYTTRRKRYSIRGRLNMNRKRLSKRSRFHKIHRSIGGFPNAKTVALRYVEDISLSPGSNSIAYKVFRMNNIYDPNYTDTGHQPMFYDNYATLYQKYRVVRATLTFIATDTAVNSSVVAEQASGTTTTTTPFNWYNERSARMFVLKDNEVNDFPSTINPLIEEGNTNLTWRFAPMNLSGRTPRLSVTGYPSAHFKCPKNDVGLSANFGSGPDKEAYFIVGVDSFPGCDSDVMNYQVIITYTVTFFDLKKNQPEN